MRKSVFRRADLEEDVDYTGNKCEYHFWTIRFDNTGGLFYVRLGAHVLVVPAVMCIS